MRATFMALAAVVIAGVGLQLYRANAAEPTASLTLATRPSPLGLGQNLFEATLKDRKGQPIADADVAIVLLMPANPKTKHPEMKVEGQLNNAGKGVYSGIVMVTMAGDWDVTLTATRDGKRLAQTKERKTAYLTRPKPPASRGQ
jgi:hypothetical protein